VNQSASSAGARDQNSNAHKENPSDESCALNFDKIQCVSTEQEMEECRKSFGESAGPKEKVLCKKKQLCCQFELDKLCVATENFCFHFCCIPTPLNFQQGQRFGLHTRAD